MGASSETMPTDKKHTAQSLERYIASLDARNALFRKPVRSPAENDYVPDYGGTGDGSQDRTSADSNTRDAAPPPPTAAVPLDPPAQDYMPPSQYVLKEIYGLTNAPDAKTAHRHLVHLRSLSVQHDRRVEIVGAGGIPVIVSSLERFGRESGSVAKQALAAIQNVSLEREHAASVSAAWGIPEVIKVMAIHSRSPGVQEMGCAALRNLTAGSAENRTEVGRMGGVRAVLGALQRHTESAKICDKGIAALGNLCLKHQENRKLIGQEGGVAVILDAMRDHSGHEGVVEKGMRTLWDLAHHWENVDVLRAEEGIADFLLGLGVQYPSRCKKKAIQIFLRL